MAIGRLVKGYLGDIFAYCDSMDHEVDAASSTPLAGHIAATIAWPVVHCDSRRSRSSYPTTAAAGRQPLHLPSRPVR